MTEVPSGDGGHEGRHLPRGLVATGAIITILASVAGLLTTGVATLYSARVASDQLKQSQEAANEKRREQAARVSYWVDVQPDGTPWLHLTNRSPDPIFNATMLFVADRGEPPDEDDPVLWTVVFVVKVPSVPPCSDLVFTSNDMRYGTDEDLSPPSDGHPLAKPPGADWLSFDKPPSILTEWVVYTDREGVMWERRGTGLLTQPAELEFATQPGVPGVVLAVQPQPLKECADAAGLTRPIR
ncbi:hypothetical protein [Streptomyces sp. NPDC020489]|uniref:hypothetical protein n=1 Tax=Streptomyces sp. NPDC020489 TaxID=3365077 RepID=UPI0037BBF7EB